MLTQRELRQAKLQSKQDATLKRFGCVSVPGLVEVRARAALQVDLSARTITGYASKFNVWDSYNDVMLPGAFKRTIAARFTGYTPPRIKVLTGHDWSAAVGLPEHMEEDSTGLLVVSKIANTERGTELLILADEGVNDGLSVGFFIPEGGSEWIDFDTVQDLDDMGYGDLPANPAWMAPRSISDTDLIEYSHTPFPAVDDARVEAREMILQSLARTVVRGAKLPGSKGGLQQREVIPYESHPLADTDEEWDGPSEIAAATTDDLMVMATWFDAEFPDVESSYKLPHHRQSDKYTVWRGVVAAMAALLGARGGVDIPDSERAGVWEHLAGHYRDFGEEPPELSELSAEELADVFPAWALADDETDEEDPGAEAEEPGADDDVAVDDGVDLDRIAALESLVAAMGERLESVALEVSSLTDAMSILSVQPDTLEGADDGAGVESEDDDAAMSAALLELTEELRSMRNNG